MRSFSFQSVFLIPVVLAFVPTAASAFPGMDPLLAKLRQTAHKQPHSSQTCANFAGSWQGTCTQVDGSTYTDQVTIDQFGCDGLAFAGDSGSYDFGGQSGSNYTSSSFTNTWTSTSDWDSSRTIANVNSVLNGRELGESTLVGGTTNAKMYLHGAQLVVETAYQITLTQGGNATTQTDSVECYYDPADNKPKK